MKRSASAPSCSRSRKGAEIGGEPPTATADEWRKDLEISEAQLAAGDVVESAEVMRELDEAIALIRGKKVIASRR